MRRLTSNAHRSASPPRKTGFQRAEQENVALNAQIGGFPNVNALREAIITTADENVALRAENERLTKIMEDCAWT